MTVIECHLTIWRGIGLIRGEELNGRRGSVADLAGCGGGGGRVESGRREARERVPTGAGERVPTGAGEKGFLGRKMGKILMRAFLEMPGLARVLCPKDGPGL